MTAHPRRAAAALLLAGGLSLLASVCAPAAGAALSPSAYRVAALCSLPAPGHAGCLGLRLVAKAPLSVPGARALPRSGLSAGGPSPAVEHTKPFPGSLSGPDLLTAYNLPTSTAAAGTQTIGIVDAYDDATAEADLERYDAQYGLPPCTAAAGCFRKVNQEGNAFPLPKSKGSAERGWAQEIATDVEVAHGICQGCRILLVEARSNSDEDLFAAEATAVRLGATEVSNSWGGEEPASDSAAFNHPGVVITASAGDGGYLDWLEEPERGFAEYPASSPHVVAVGGTRLSLTSAKAWQGETVWNDGGASGGFTEGAGAGGGGCSVPFAAPSWQLAAPTWTAVGCSSRRAVADVSADGDPYTGVAVYDSTESPEGNKGWEVIGGTSVSSPIIAATFALAGGAHGVEYPARTLYENAAGAPGWLHDVIAGSNGECLKPFNGQTGTSACSAAEEAESCSGHAICLARAGYDGPTGVGTPDGLAAFAPGAQSALPGGENTNVSGAGTSAGGEAAPGPTGPSGPVPPAGTTAGSGTVLAQAPAGSSQPSEQAAPLSAVVSSPKAVVSAVSLSRGATIALKHAHPRASAVRFAFAISASARVRVTLARRLRVHGRLQWRAVLLPYTILATRGRVAAALHGRGALGAGRYRLTLAPAGGTAGAVSFSVR